MFFEEKFTDTEGNRYELQYFLTMDGKEIEVKVNYVGWFIKWISIPIEHIFDSKKYILKNIRKHNMLSDIFEKLNEEEIAEIKKKIMNISIESCEMKSVKANIVDVTNLRIKR